MSEIDAAPPAAELFSEMLRIQGETARQMLAVFLPEAGESPSGDAAAEWGEAALRLQRMWLEFHEQQAIPAMPVPLFTDPVQWMGLMQGWYQQMPWLDPARQARLVEEGMALWEEVLAQYGIGPVPRSTDRKSVCRGRTNDSPMLPGANSPSSL